MAEKFKYNPTKNRETSTEELIERGILPEDLPELILDLRKRVITEKGFSKWEQTALQLYDFNERNGIKKVEVVSEVPETRDRPVVISLKNLSKTFKSTLAKRGEKKEKVDFHALSDISFDVREGDVLGIFGTNGSGKSTVSRVIAGICDYEQGSLEVKGTACLIPSKLKMKDQMTGEENIVYKCALMGLHKAEVERVKAFVEEYSELGKQLYVPVKEYSSGMRAKLGFAISLALEPDIYILDECLSVGDASFKKKGKATMQERSRTAGNTFVFVSHNISEITDFCNRTVWIECGKLVEYGDAQTVAGHYKIYTDYLSELGKAKKSAYLQELNEYRFEKVEDRRSLPKYLRWLKRRFAKVR